MRLFRSAAARPLRLAAPLLILAGCVEIDPGPGGNDNGNGTTQPPQTIRIRVVNATDTNLDPEIYTADAPVSVSELFTFSNKYTDFGVFGLGILGRFASAEFDLPCSEVRVLGTLGGRFGEDYDNPDGSGRQIVLTQENSIFCDGEVTFTFSRAGNGFTTSYDVAP